MSSRGLDPFADDPDFQYLCVDRKKLMAEQTKPFDGKKNCWIPDEKTGYIKAEIQATKGEDVTVLTENMEVRNFMFNHNHGTTQVQYGEGEVLCNTT